MIVVGCFAFVLYLLCAGQLSLDETVTGVLVAALVTVWLAWLRRTSPHRFKLGRGAVVEMSHALARIGETTARTALILVRTALQGGSAGKSDTQPFRDGIQDDPIDSGRRAAIVLAASLAPDSFVVTAERGRGSMLRHAIVWRPSR